MKITSVYCDVHTDIPMRQAETKVLIGSDWNTIHTMACVVPGCNRNYRAEIFGYHDFAVGERPNVGDDSKKLKCGLGHDVRYMVITRINNTLTWACPDTDKNCNQTKPYSVIENSCTKLTADKSLCVGRYDPNAS